MRIAIGSDHAGFPLKEEIRQALLSEGHQVEDFGVYSLDRVDYPDVALRVARAVAAREFERAILICGTGIGVSIAANKVRGIRAALCTDCYMARMAREHNDAQILCMGARVLGPGSALEIVRAFLESEFLGGRHAVRVEKIAAADAAR